MRAKLVNENIRFERGQDPKRAMDIGSVAANRELINNTVWSLNLFPDLYEIVGHDWDFLGHPILVAKLKDPIFNPERSHVAVTDIPGISIQHSPNELQAYSDIKDKIRGYVQNNESYNFERGQDPKRAMDIGNQADLKQRASEIEWDWYPEWEYEGTEEEILDLRKYKGFNVKIARLLDPDPEFPDTYAVSDTGEPYMDKPTFYEDPEEAWEYEKHFLDEFSEEQLDPSDPKL